jgi:hypothetical protein
MSNGQVNTSNRSNLFGELRVAQGEISRACATAPLAIRNSIVGAVSDVIFNLEGITQGKAEATRLISDMRYAPAEQNRQASAVMTKALAASKAANTALQAAAESARKTLEASLLPKLPKGVEEVTVLDRKADLTRLLANTDGAPGQKIQALSKALRRAIQTGDDLTAYVLTSRMSFVYQSLGIGETALAQEFARILGEPVEDDDPTGDTDARDPVPGGVLLAGLQHGGPNTVPGLLVVAINIQYREAQAWDSWFATVSGR